MLPHHRVSGSTAYSTGSLHTDRGRRLLAGHMLIEIRSQALDGIARGQPGGTVELARLSHLAIGDAGDPPCGLEVITGQRRGMFADHGPCARRRCPLLGSGPLHVSRRHGDDRSSCFCGAVGICAAAPGFPAAHGTPPDHRSVTPEHYFTTPHQPRCMQFHHHLRLVCSSQKESRREAGLQWRVRPAGVRGGKTTAGSATGRRTYA